MKWKWFKYVRYIVLFIIIAFAISRLSPRIKDFSKLWILKDSIDIYFIGLALATQCTQYIGDGWLSQLLLKIVKIKVNLKDSFRIASLNVFAAHLLPVGEAGGMAAAYHFYRKLGVSTESFIFLTICWGAITNVLLLLLFVVPLLLSPHMKTFIDPSTTTIVILTILVIGSLIFYVRRRQIIHFAEKLIGKHSWAQGAFSFIRNHRYYQQVILHHPKELLLALFAGSIYYLSNVGTLYFSFLAFHEHPSILLVTFAYAASLILGRLTLTPGGIGTTEATLAVIFTEAGIDAQVSLAVILLYRLISFWLPIPAGFLSYLSLNKHTRDRADLPETVGDLAQGKPLR